MKLLRMFVIGVLAALLLAFVSVPVAFAQDVQDVVEVTPVVEPAPDMVTVPVEVVQSQINWNGLGQVLLYALIALLGGGTFAAVFSHMSKANKDEVERNYHALPPEWQETIQGILGIAKSVLDTANRMYAWADEVTDGLPNAEPDEESIRHTGNTEGLRAGTANDPIRN
jgi:hypothetical protein